MSLLFDDYALSFSHGIIKVAGRQFIGIRGVSIDQQLTEGVVYGTDMRPLKRTRGQLSMGVGQLVFSDMDEAVEFYKALAPSPMTAIWDLDYTLARTGGAAPSTKSVECISCRLTGFNIAHEAGPDALPMTFPFTFMSARINGVDLSLADVLLNIAAGIVGNTAANLLKKAF